MTFSLSMIPPDNAKEKPRKVEKDTLDACPLAGVSLAMFNCFDFIGSRLLMFDDAIITIFYSMSRTIIDRFYLLLFSREEGGQYRE